MTGNRKKVNTLELIQQMARKNKETLNDVENMKQERSSKTSESEPKQHLQPKSVKKEVRATTENEVEAAKPKNIIKKNPSALEQLNVLLHNNNFQDKKEPFVMSLSGDCLAKYEKLATGTSYILGIKSSRNNLLRKILEDFISKNYIKLIKEIDLK